MNNLVSMSDKPFQLVAVVCLIAALLFIVRVAVDSLTPFKVLPEITNGLLLNAIVIAFLIETALICAVGEFAIRNFTLGRKLPIYVVRERWRRQNGVPVRVRPLVSAANIADQKD